MEIDKQIARSSRFILIGWVTAAAIFGSLTLWSAFMPLQGAVVAPGTVQVVSNRKTVQHLEGGIVREILISEGDDVEAGDVLIRLDRTVPQAQSSRIEARISELAARHARLVAERDGVESVDFHASMYSFDADLSTNLVESQMQLFKARRSRINNERDLLEQKIRQHESRIKGFRLQIQSFETQVNLLKQEIGNLRKLYERNLTSLPQILALERELAKQEGFIGAGTADIAESEGAIAENRLELLRVVERVYEDVVTEIQEIEPQIIELIEQRRISLDYLQRTDIVAPRSGRILSLSVHNVGAVIAPGQPILQIIPNDDRLVIVARIRPQDIDKVTVGAQSRIRFPAFDLRTTPESQGVVSKVSPDNIIEEGSGYPYYSAYIEIVDSAKVNSTLDLVPGMPADVFVNTGPRTIASYLFKPIIDSMRRSLIEG